MVKDLTNLESYTLENKTDEVVAVRYYLVNFVEKLNPGDTITITPRTSEELAYYMKIQEGLETASKEDTKPETPEDFIRIGINAINTELGHNYIFKEITSIESSKVEFVVTRDGSDVSGRTTFEEYEGQDALVVKIRWAVAYINQSGEVLHVEEQQN